MGTKTTTKKSRINTASTLDEYAGRFPYWVEGPLPFRSSSEQSSRWKLKLPRRRLLCWTQPACGPPDRRPRELLIPFSTSSTLILFHTTLFSTKTKTFCSAHLQLFLVHLFKRSLASAGAHNVPEIKFQRDPSGFLSSSSSMLNFSTILFNCFALNSAYSTREPNSSCSHLQ